jgi:hypothetical protein
MKKSLVVAALFAAMSAAVASAEGLPSQAKLSQLGLSSMDVVSDAEGTAVRGKFLGTGGVLNLGASIVFTPLGGAPAIPPVAGNTFAVFPTIAAQSYIAGNAPRALGASAFGGQGFATVNVTTTNGNPTFSGYVNVPATASIADVSGSGQLSVQFFGMSVGN